MTITLTREEAQQILDVLWNAFDLQQEEINQHIIKYGEFYRPQRVEFMKKELGSIEQMKETINNKIAQPEKTDMQIGLTYEEANPPVAWAWDINNGAGYSSRGIGFEQTNIPFAKHTPLYTAPQKKEWVGLTIEEINEVFGGEIYDENSGLLTFIRAIEAKLKEKNYG